MRDSGSSSSGRTARNRPRNRGNAGRAVSVALLPAASGALSAPTPAAPRRRLERTLDERLDVIVGDALLEPVTCDACEIHAELARELAHRRPGVCAREARLVDGRQITAVGGRHTELGSGSELAGRRCGCWRGCRARRRLRRRAARTAVAAWRARARLRRSRGGRCRLRRRRAHCRCRRGGGRRGAGRTPSDLTVATRSPVETVPPLVMCTFSMTPLAVEGTSMVALSDSSVTSGVSTRCCRRVSPARR